MKKFLVFIICVFIIQISFGQQKVVDSLLNELNKHPQEDTSRINLLNQIANEYSKTDPVKGIAAGEHAIALAERLNNKPKLAAAYEKLALNYNSKGSDTLSLFLYNKALALYQQSNNPYKSASVLHNIGIIYQKINCYIALECHQKALQFFKLLNDTLSMGSEYLSIGVDYQYLSDFPKALENQQMALLIFEKKGNKGMANALTNLGIIYNSLSNYPKALEYHLKALKIFESINNKEGMANELGNIGNTYDNMDDSVNALQSYQKALDISTEISSKNGIASNLCNMGIVYNYYGNHYKAFDYLTKATNYYEQSGNKIGASVALNETGKIFSNAPEQLLIQLNINPKDRYNKSIEYYQQSLKLAKDVGSISYQLNAWANLSEAYEKKNDFYKALEAFKQSQNLKDSAFNDKKKRDVTKLEMQYVFNKKEDSIKVFNDKKHALALSEINRQKVIRNASVTIAAILILVAIAGTILYKRRKDIVEKKKEAEFNAQVADTEMKALRAQMNPHFIYNSLNSINDYIDKHDTATATSYTTKFAKLMRMILENSEKKEITLTDDLSALELYMQLENMRLRHKFIYEIKIDEDIDADNTLIPPLILQPFVENSIWHGFSKKEDGGKILIHIKKQGGMISCIVEDNGVGIHEVGNLSADQNLLYKKSLGMKITKARIDILNKIKKSNAAIKTYDLEKGTKVEVIFPEALAF